jgi:hypothetical protein
MASEPARLEIIAQMTPEQREQLARYYGGLDWQTALATNERDAHALFLGAEAIDEFPVETGEA